MLFKKYTIFTCIFGLGKTQKLLPMARRSLGVLRNLDKWASGNTKKTKKEKVKNRILGLSPKPMSQSVYFCIYLKSLSLDCDKMAHDRGTVHMINAHVNII